MQITFYNSMLPLMYVSIIISITYIFLKLSVKNMEIDRNKNNKNCIHGKTLQ